MDCCGPCRGHLLWGLTRARVNGLATEVNPEVYDPQTQGAREAMSFVVRTFGNPLGMLPAVRREIAALDARLAIYDVHVPALRAAHVEPAVSLRSE